LQQANLFFLNHCHADKLVYISDKKDCTWAYPEQNIQAVCEKAKSRFKREIEKVRTFRKGVQFFKGQGHLRESAFMLHQSYELAYRLLEPMVCGSLKVCHSIKNHQAFVLKSISPIKGMFMVESESESALLDILDNAYSAARYSDGFKVSENEIVRLSQKLGHFIKGVKRLHEMQLDRFKETVMNPPNTDQDRPIPLDELKRIKALTKENLVLLNPTGGEDPGHYLNHARIHGYAETFGTLRSMLNVCILALDGQLDLTLDIKDIGTDVKRVLEFGKCLIPFEEGVYLDQMRELISLDVEPNRDRV
ncbi:HEPN domain-containing protein, partial [Sediminicola luteus]